MAIDIGGGAADYSSARNLDAWHRDRTNPANASGTLDTIEVWMYESCTGLSVGTVDPADATGTPRDTEAIGSVTSGAKRTFTGLSITVVSGDYIGAYDTGSKKLEMETSGASGIDRWNGFSWAEYDSNNKLALYGTGTETSTGTILVIM